MRTRITRGPATFGSAGEGVKRHFNNDSNERGFGSRAPRGERKSFGENRERRSFGERGDRKPFGERSERRSFGEDRPRRSFGEDRPRREGGFGENRERRSFGERGDRKPFGERSERRSFGEDRPRRSFGEDRPRRSFGEDKPRREGGFGENRERRSFGENSERRSFGERGDRKPFGERSERRSFGEDRPRRSFGEDKPRREGGFSGRKGGFKSLEDRYNRPTSRPKKEKSEAKQEYNPLLVRLNKFIANSGICSRREADEYIAAGLVTVNGQVVDQVGSRVNPTTDEIRFNDERLRGEKRVYVLMNKPKDYVTTTSDPHADKNVMDLISKDLCPERIFPVGRLDKATTGVLLFTNDGELTEKLTHPSYQRKKIYQVTLDKNLKKPDFDALIAGFDLEDGFIAADTLSYLEERNDEVGIEIHSGRNRIVRRMFEHLGYTVKKLDRVYFSGLTKKNLRRGQWRFLTDLEVSTLQMGSFE